MEEYNFDFHNTMKEEISGVPMWEVSEQLNAKLNDIVSNVQNIVGHVQTITQKCEDGLGSIANNLQFPPFPPIGIRPNLGTNPAHNNSLGTPPAYSKEEQPNQPSILPRAVAESIEIPTVSSLTEVAGVKDVKRTIYTMVILPKSQPQLFKNHRVSNTILLYGPPGTGKTRIVHGLAAESGSVLHTISVGSLLSCFVGDTEKNLKCLFDYLREVDKFSILFIDEIDSLCRKRTGTESDYSRRIKTELMCHMTKMETCQNILIIAATNCPWDLDSAILRRFHKKLFVPLPDTDDRLELFRMLTAKLTIQFQNEDEFVELVSICEGFSCSDIATLVQDALDMPLDELQATTIWNKTPEGLFTPASNKDNFRNISIKELQDLPSGSVMARPLTVSDFVQAARKIQVTVTAEDNEKYEMFRKRGR